MPFKVFSRNVLYDVSRMRSMIHNDRSGGIHSMKILYLHIGTTKTATTSIQRFLEQNNEVLKTKGYIYPASQHIYQNVNARRNGHFLVKNVTKSGGGRDHDLENQYLEEGYCMIAGLMENYDNVILSDEAIWHTSSYQYTDLFKDLKNRALQDGYQVKIIVYLRRQDAFYLSRWNQAVKQNFGADARMTCDQYMEESLKKDGKILNYAKKLDDIAAVFGKEHMIVRRYEPDSWLDGSVICDFMHAIGLPVSEEFLPLAENVNLRLGKNETELKRIINSNADLSKKEVTYLGKYLQRQTKTHVEKNDTCMLSADEVQEFLAPYETVNEYVAQTYIKDGKRLFHTEIDHSPKWNADNDEMLESVVTFFTSVMIDLDRRIQEQDRKIQQQERTIAEMKQEQAHFRKRVLMFIGKVKHPVRTIWHKVWNEPNNDSKQEGE